MIFEHAKIQSKQIIRVMINRDIQKTLRIQGLISLPLGSFSIWRTALWLYPKSFSHNVPLHEFFFFCFMTGFV